MGKVHRAHYQGEHRMREPAAGFPGALWVWTGQALPEKLGGGIKPSGHTGPTISTMAGASEQLTGEAGTVPRGPGRRT